MVSGRVQVAYLLGEFPSLSETFILREIRELQRQGVAIQIFALWQGRRDVVHRDAETLLPAVEYAPPWADPRIRQAWAEGWARRPYPLMRMVGRMAQAAAGKGPPGVRSFLSHLAYLPMGAYFARRIADLGGSHIHAHWAGLPALVAWVAAELSDRSFSFTAHARDLFQETFLLREKIAQADWVATCSEYNRRYLEKQFPDVVRGKVFVAYHGLDFREWTREKRREEEGESSPLLLSVGRLQAKKGFSVLLEACALLQARGVPFRCVIVGEGPERERLQQLAREWCLSGAVAWTGALTQEELRPYYAAADVFALPCVVTPQGDRDVLPNVLLEALAMGLPVVTTPVSAIPEVIEDGTTGLLVTPGEAGALAQALERVLSDPPLRQKLGQQGQARVRRQFDITRNVAPLVQRFQQTGVKRRYNPGRGLT